MVGGRLVFFYYSLEYKEEKRSEEYLGQIREKRRKVKVKKK